MTSATSLRVARIIRATPARLFAAWTEPEQLAAWWSMDTPGWTFAGAAVDLRVGGSYRVAMTAPDGTTHAATGVYREVVPPSRLVFTWDWEAEEHRVGPTLVTVELRDLLDGRTEVVVTHEGFADAGRIPGHESGWTQLLTRLERTIEGNQRRQEEAR